MSKDVYDHINEGLQEILTGLRTTEDDPHTLKQAAIQHLRAARMCIAQIPEDHDPSQNGNYHEATEQIDTARYRLGD